MPLLRSFAAPSAVTGTPRPAPLCYVLTGVSGAGKSTVGRLLAERLSCEFYDGDDFHSRSNIDKMKKQIPLTDADRDPWLQELAKILNEHVAKTAPCVLACSCLKKRYRRVLCGHDCDNECQLPRHIAFVLLQPSAEELRKRLSERSHGGTHFMPPELLDSQLETLEVDPDAIVFGGNLQPTQIVEQIIAARS